jgi:hypothetical protein
MGVGGGWGWLGVDSWTSDGLTDGGDDEANHIKDSTSWEKPRSLENLPDFLEAFAGESEKLDRAPKKNGSPHTLIVAGAGLRAADLVRYERRALSFRDPSGVFKTCGY